MNKTALIKKIADNYLSLIHIYSNPYKALENAHAIAILTEWNEFKMYDWKQIYTKIYKPAFVFDGRNLLDLKKMHEIGFTIRCIGK